MSNYVYYKATDEDGNTVLRHGWKKHKYLYIKNGKYVYPEDIYKTAKKAAYKITRSGQKLANDAKPYVSSAKKSLKKTANFAKKVATRDAAFKMAATKYLVDKAANSPTANAAKSKARSVVSKAEYKIERAGQKLSDDANNAYKSAKKKAKTTANAAKSKARSVVSKAEYKLTRAGEKLTNDVKSSGAYKSAKKGYKSAKKGINSISKNANKAYKSAKKGINSISKNANKAYKSAQKKAKKVNRTFNKVKRAGKAYLDYLTK